MRHPSAGILQVDTGLHPLGHRSLADLGWLMRIVFRQLESVGPSFDHQLRELGVEPEQVDQVVMTHLHVDHTGGMRLLPRARFVCAQREWPRR